MTNSWFSHPFLCAGIGLGVFPFFWTWQPCHQDDVLAGVSAYLAQQLPDGLLGDA